MPKWANSALLDGGSDILRTRAATTNRIREHVIKAYAAGDSYATVTGNSCGNVAMVAADFVQSGAAGSPRVTTVAAKSIALTADSGSGPDTHIALVDTTTSEVLYVTDETNNQQLYNGNTFSCPAYTYSVGQPA